MKHLSLRLRVFLFFALLAIGSAVIVGAAAWYGASRDEGGLMVTVLMAVFGISGLVAGIWLLFDENVAKPVERLAADLRTRAEAGITSEINPETARYLGDLAPAAQALNTRAAQSSEVTAEVTAALAQEKDQLVQLLSLIPVAILMVTRDYRIILYDQQASAVLSRIWMPKLNASLMDYFDKDSVDAAFSDVKEGQNVSCTLRDVHERAHEARIHYVPNCDAYFLILEEQPDINYPQPDQDLVYEFALLGEAPPLDMENTPLEDLTYTVFDTETTGLDPQKDSLLQVGAVRVLNGRMVDGERFDHLINPGVPIPTASTAVHHIDDKMVADAETPPLVVARFRQFAEGSVLVAHNAAFDMTFLNRVEKGWPHPVVDTVLVSAMLFGITESHTLDALCDRFDIEIPPDLRHTGLGDAIATAQALCCALPMLKAQGIVTLSDFQTKAREFSRLQKLPDAG